MDEFDTDKSYFAGHLIDMFPAFIRSEILQDSIFCRDVDVSVDATLSFGDSGVELPRSKLFNAVRNAFLSEGGFSILEDEVGSKTEITVNINNPRTVQILSGGNCFNSDIFWPLNPDKLIRLSIFKDISKERRLSQQDIARLADVLSGDMDDVSVDEVIEDINFTPVYIERMLREDTRRGSSKIEGLVPSSIRYYERLVGAYSSSRNILDYSTNELKKHFSGTEFTHFDLIFCAHSSIAKAIYTESQRMPSFKEVIRLAFESNNPFSLICCLEIGLLMPTCEHKDDLLKILKLLTEMCSDGQVKSLIYLFIFIDGELTRLGLFNGKPAFYRRLAAFGQASLISKVMTEQRRSFEDIDKWAVEERGLIFFCQSLIDLRTEPRWLPDYASSEQLLDDIRGRLNSALANSGNQELVQELQSEIHIEQSLPLSAFFAGALEGNVDAKSIPDEIGKIIEDALQGEASLENLTALINVVQIGKVDSKYAELAASLLENCQHQLEGNVNKDVIIQILRGLAIISAHVRSPRLATSVMVLSRVYRDYLEVNSYPDHLFAIGLIAAAAYENKDEWADFVGQWVFEIANLNLDDETKNRLNMFLKQICVLEPYLFYTCSNALEILK